MKSDSFPVVLFIIPYKMVLTFECADKILNCDHSYTYWKAIAEKYFPEKYFIILYKVVPTFESKMKSWSVTIQMKATEQCFPVVLFIMLYKVGITFHSEKNSLSVTI